MPSNIDIEKEKKHSLRCHWLLKKRFYIPLLLLAAVAAYLAWDYYPPSAIPLEPDQVWGLACLRAEGLIIQQRDPEGNMWATRGMWAYRCGKKQKRFVRQYHIPTGFSVYWLRNFSLIRWLTNRSECVELIPLPDGEACVMSAGHIWYRSNSDAEFEKTFTLRHYGFGVGVGIRAPGLARRPNGTIIFGEYFRNASQGDVCLFASADNGKTWKVAYTFEAGRIRHVHAVQWDPYTGRIWVCAGDKDKECMIARTSAVGETLHPIGQDAQMWRSCMLAFTEDAVLWGSDTSPPNSGIFRWDRKTKEVKKITVLTGSSWSATQLAGGTLVVQAKDYIKKGSKKQARFSLWVSTDDGLSIKEIPCGLTFKEGGSYPYLRFDRYQGDRELWLSCVKIENYNGDLLVIPEKELVKRVTSPR